MLTDDGPVLLECNARFGDPETQVLLPRLAVALGPLLLAAARGELAGAARALGLADGRLPAFPGATVGIVLASAGYPDAPRAGGVISGLDVAADDDAVVVLHAGTAIDPEGNVITAGGRVLTVVGRGPDLEAARVAGRAGGGRHRLRRRPATPRHRPCAGRWPLPRAGVAR